MSREGYVSISGFERSDDKFPLLGMPNFKLPFVIETDASSTGFRAILMH